MTRKDDSNPIEAALKEAVKHAAARGATKDAGHIGDVLGSLRKGHIGDAFAASVARGEMSRTPQPDPEQQKSAAPIEKPYIVSGSARGTIGRYATIQQAAKAADKDSRECRRLSSPGSLTRTYSDARVMRADGEPLTDAERLAIYDATA